MSHILIAYSQIVAILDIAYIGGFNRLRERLHSLHAAPQHKLHRRGGGIKISADVHVFISVVNLNLSKRAAAVLRRYQNTAPRYFLPVRRYRDAAASVR